MNSNEIVRITDENYTPELIAKGYMIGDEMPMAPITGEEDYEVTQDFLDMNPEMATGDDAVKVGDVIKVPTLGEIPVKEVPPAPTTEANTGIQADADANVDADAPVRADPVKVLGGKLIISEGTREVEGRTFHTVRLEDGSSQDLTDAEYEDQVRVQEN